MELFQHNKCIIDKYKKLRKIHKNILIIQGTGLGKTNVAIKIIELYYKNKPILYVVPKDVLKSNVKRNEYWNYPNVEFICYQSLKKYNPKNYSLCIFDEAHRACAPKWILESRRFINCESCNVLGLTATEVRMDGINVAKHLFNEDGTIYGIDIFEAIELGILPRPNYVSAELEPEKTIDEIEHMVANCTDTKRYLIIDKLKYIKENDFNEMKIENIIPKHSNGSNKFMIFVSSIEECEKWCPRFKRILNTKKVFKIHTCNGADHNREIIEYFNKYNGSDNIAIIGIDILLEGLHIEGLSQIIMLRNTKSYPVYIQMLGRALSCVDKNTTPVIFDFVKNYKIKEPDEEYIPYIINNRVSNINNDEKPIRYNKIKIYFNIIKDYTVDFDEIFDIIKRSEVVWTDEMMKDIMDVKLSSVSISKKYNISSVTVDKKRNELNIRTNYNGFNKVVWTDEMMKDIMNPELSGVDIAKKYSISAGSVSRKRCKIGVTSVFGKIIWTDEMMKDIMDVKLSSISISKKYNISSVTVDKKRNELGIIRNKKNVVNRDNLMTDIMNPELTGRYLTKKYHISDTFITQKRKELGIITKYTKTIWTDEMMKDIMNPELSGVDIAKKYNISYNAVSSKRISLGLKKTSPTKTIWTDEMMKDIMNPELSNVEISKKYSISAGSVSKKRCKIGVTGIRFGKIIWTDEMIQDVMNPELSDTNIARKYSISRTAVSEKREKLGVISNYKIQKQ